MLYFPGTFPVPAVLKTLSSASSASRTLHSAHQQQPRETSSRSPTVRTAYRVFQQESPAIADKPARRESQPKLLQFDVPTTLSLTILAYLHSFSCCCVWNLRNPAKFTKNSDLWSSRSSKVIDLGVNGKPISLLSGQNLVTSVNRILQERQKTFQLTSY